ncbi:MAG: hypothetical protein UIL37_01630 [Clostridia bacterium]|nr:hypothetical protein [Clostridia bacterium]
MEGKKEIYRGLAVVKKNNIQTVIFIGAALILGVALINVASRLPFAGFIDLAVIAFLAVLINRVLKQGTFIVTYVLYEGVLLEFTRYGLIEKETARFTLSECRFGKDSIVFEGRTYPFYPDEELKKLLNL